VLFHDKIHDEILYHKLIFCTDYGYIETVEKEFKDLLSKEKENIKPCEENVLVSGMKNLVSCYIFISLLINYICFF